jgi:hypothetical protein
MPLFAVHALHHRARCDRCGALSDVHASEAVAQARAEARAHYESAGWNHRVPPGEPAHLATWLEQHGGGEWICPRCALVC